MSSAVSVRLELPATVHRALKAQAAASGETLTQYLLNILNRSIEKKVK